MKANRMASLSTTAALFAASGALLAQESPGTVFLGAREGCERTVVTGTETESLPYFADSDAGWYSKVGAGGLVFPLSAARSPAPMRIALQGGSLTLGRGADGAGARPTTADAPSVIREKAAFWLDSRTNLAYDDEAAGTVAHWYDVRETTADIASGATKFPSAHAVQLYEDHMVYPKLTEDAGDGNEYVNFNSIHASTAMKFAFAGESSPTGTLANVRHLFLAHRMTTGMGFFWGMNEGVQYFCPSQYKGDFPSSYIGINSANNNAGWFGTPHGRFWRDGVRIDPLAETVSEGRTEVLEFAAAPALPVAVGNFFCERGRWTQSYEYRCGGDDIGESIVFDCELTEAERLAVSQYLLARWRPGLPRGTVEVATAPGTDLVVTGAADEPAFGEVAISGQAAIRKTGAGTASVRRVNGADLSDAVRVEGGALSYEIAEVSPRLNPGEGLAAEKDAWDTLSLTGCVASAGAVVVSGDATFGLPGIPAGTENLSVDGGCLVLGGKSRVREVIPATETVWATIPNAGFEDDLSGWTCEGATLIQVQDYSTTSSWKTPYRDAGDTVHYGAPEGTKVLMVRHNPFLVHNSITFPCAGVYDLSFAVAMRADSKYTPSVTDVLLFREGETNVVARLKTKYQLGRFQRYVFRLPRVEAGTYRVGFRNETPYSTTDRKEQHIHLDDLKARLVLDDDPALVPVPNGGFEREEYPDAKEAEQLFGIRTDLAATGWTLSNAGFGAAGATTPDVAVVSSLGIDSAYCPVLSPSGDRQLLFVGTAGAATSGAFNVPAGEYAIGFRAARSSRSDFKPQGGATTHKAQLPPDFRVELLVNGVSVLTNQTGAISSFYGTAFASAGTVAVSASDALSIRVTQTAADSGAWCACGMIDDIRLIRRAADGELLADGSFETGSPWTLDNCRDAQETKASAAIHALPGGDLYGYATCDGAHALRLGQCACASQAIDVPAAGWYELRCWLRSRVDYRNDPTRLTRRYGGNQLRVWWTTDGSGVTNELYRSPCVYSTNFLEHTAYIRLPQGRVRLGLQGVNSKGVEQVAAYADDANMFIDLVSLKPVAAPVAPAALEGKSVELLNGGSVRLDFDGQVRLGEFLLDGRRVSGEIDAAAFPGRVMGCGSFYVAPSATMVIFR